MRVIFSTRFCAAGCRGSGLSTASRTTVDDKVLAHLRVGSVDAVGVSICPIGHPALTWLLLCPRWSEITSH